MITKRLLMALPNDRGEWGTFAREKYKRRFLFHGSCEGKTVYWDMEMNYWR